MARVPGPSGVRRAAFPVTYDLTLPNTAAGFARGVEKLSQDIKAVDDKFRKARQQSELSNAMLAAKQKLKEAEIAFESDPDHGTFETRHRALAENLQKNIASGIKDKEVRAAFTQEFNDLQLDSEFIVRRMGRKRFVDEERANVERRQRAYVNLYAQSNTESERQKLMTLADQNVSAAAQVGILTEQEARDRFEDFNAEIQTAEILGMIRDNPGQAIEELTDPAKFPDIEQDFKERLITSAQTRMESLQARAHREEIRRENARIKAQKEKYRQNELERYARILNNEEGVNEWTLFLDAENDEIDAAGLRRLSQDLEARDAPADDINVLLQLRDLAHTHDPGFRDALTLATNSGDLTSPSAVSVFDLWVKTGRAGSILADERVQRTRRRLEAIAGRPPGILGTLDQNTADRMSAVQRDFDDRVERTFEKNDGFLTDQELREIEFDMLGMDMYRATPLATEGEVKRQMRLLRDERQKGTISIEFFNREAGELERLLVEIMKNQAGQ